METSSYAVNLLGHLHQLFLNGHLCDLALQIHNRVFNVHKVVLTAASQYFKALYDSGSLEGPLYILQDVSVDTIVTLIDFMYTGELPLNAQTICVILEAAKSLAMPQVVSLCEDFLKKGKAKSDINSTNVSQLSEISKAPCLQRIKIESNEYSSISNGNRVPFVAELHIPKMAVQVNQYNNTDHERAVLTSGNSERDYEDEVENCIEVEEQPICDTENSNLKLKINLKKCRAPGVDKTALAKQGTVLLIKHQSKASQTKKKKHANKENTVTKVKRGPRSDNSAKSKKVQRNCINLQSKGRVYFCHTCDAKFYFKSSLLLHRNVVHVSGLISARYRLYRWLLWYTTITNRHKEKSTFTEVKPKLTNQKAQEVINSSRSLRSKGNLNIKSIQVTNARNKHDNCEIIDNRNTNIYAHSKSVLVCDLCHVKCSKMSSFKCHLYRMHYKYTCSHCEKNIRISDFRRHYIIKHLKSYDKKRKLFKCGRCHPKIRIFMFKNNLKNHVLNFHLGKANKYNVKNAVCKTKVRRGTIMLKKKSKTVKHSALELKCEEKTCNYITRSKKAWKQHIREKHVSFKFECKECSFSTLVHKEHEKHILQHKVKENKKCNICNKVFHRPALLRLHKFTSHKIEEPGVKILHCDYEGCSYACIGSTLLKKHQLRHSAERSFLCKQCGKQLKSAITLQKHIRRIHIGIKPYICEICGISYGEESELKVHINRHGDTKTFCCTKCDYSCYDKANYKSHLFNRHGVKLSENMKTFSCTMCDFVTDVKYRYTDHMRVHMKIRDIKCTDCDKSFMTRKALRGHVVKVHMPKNLRCDFCSYATADTSKLREHVRIMHTHRNFKPYKCAYCAFTSATGGNCRKHVMQKHRNMEVKVIKLDVQLPLPQNPPAIPEGNVKVEKKTSIVSVSKNSSKASPSSSSSNRKGKKKNLNFSISHHNETIGQTGGGSHMQIPQQLNSKDLKPCVLQIQGGSSVIGSSKNDVHAIYNTVNTVPNQPYHSNVTNVKVDANNVSQILVSSNNTGNFESSKILSSDSIIGPNVLNYLKANDNTASVTDYKSSKNNTLIKKSIPDGKGVDLTVYQQTGHSYTNDNNDANNVVEGTELLLNSQDLLQQQQIIHILDGTNINDLIIDGTSSGLASLSTIGSMGLDQLQTVILGGVSSGNIHSQLLGRLTSFTTQE